MLTHGRMHGQTDNGRKVITIAHPEQSSGELKKHLSGKKNMLFNKIALDSSYILKYCIEKNIQIFIVNFEEAYAYRL